MSTKSESGALAADAVITNPQFNADIQDFTKFVKLFTQLKVLGSGGDGTVYAYEHNASNLKIAVKVPRWDGRRDAKYAGKGLFDEIRNLKVLGQHDHIAGMLTYSEFHLGCGPAIFLPFCQLGDIFSYIRAWSSQHQPKGAPPRVSEVTLWKLLNDMSLDLDFIHNRQDVCYVHNDIKPENILVSLPSGWNRKDGIPTEPMFKIADFARMAAFPTPSGCHPVAWRGTYEYSPPLEEQKAPVRPSADIWSLGATLQAIALDISPIQSRKAFIWSRKVQGLGYPDLCDQAA